MDFIKYIKALLLSISISSFTTLSAATEFDNDVPLLKKSDVQAVMQQLFDLHLDQKQMTPELLQRAMKIYVESFDPERIYLLEEETIPYTHLSEPALNKIMEAYQKGDYTIFYQLQGLFQTSIHRSRALRQELFKDQASLFAKIEGMSWKDLPQRDEKIPFAKNQSELKQRMTEKFTAFYLFQKQQGKNWNSAKAPKALALFEKRLEDQEKEHLFQNNDGNSVQPSIREDGIVLTLLKALAQSLDAHTAFYSPMEAFDMKARLEKGFYGLGIILQETVDGITISRIIPEGPAAKSGLVHVDDRIVEIDGKIVESHSFKEIVNLLRGSQGSKVRLSLERLADNGEIELASIELMRDEVSLEDERVKVEYEPYENGIIGKITLYSFYEGDNGVSSEKDLRNAISDLQKKGEIKGLILDLRENTGGFLQQAVKVVGLFITSGVVVMSKYSDGHQQYYRDVDGYAYYNGPLVVLISKLSASAAEIVSQALQEYGVAIVVGDEHTYGKGSIQHQTITDGIAPSFFKVTVGRYYTVSGDSPQMDGVHADIVVPGPYSSLKIGEAYLDYPLKSDVVAGAYLDELRDVDPIARFWFKKYYLPTLQVRVDAWRSLLPLLRHNSEERIKGSPEFQSYLQDISNPSPELALEEYKEQDSKSIKEDMQMVEGVNILRDMIFFSKASAHPDIMSHNNSP